MAEKPGYYAILTADARYDTALSSTAKLMYAEITALSNSFGYCTAQNKYFADLYGVTIRSVQGILEQLSNRGYIKIERDKKPRKIFIAGVKKISSQGEKNFMVEGEKNFTHNIIKDNIIYNNICSEQSSKPPIITMTLNDKSEYPITEEYFQEMKSLYPNADVMTELRKMRAWLINNPNRRKTKRGIKKFINSWLSRAQDTGRQYYVKAQPEQERPGYYECVNEGDYSDCIGFTVE